MENTEYTIRKFSVSDLQAYKAIRLEALLKEPGIFGNSYALESSFAEDEWMNRVAGNMNACFGLYHLGELVGVTGIYIDADKPANAYMTQSYIRSAHRGKRLSRMLYDARINWAKSNGVKYLQIGHKESNLISKAANQHYNFKFTHREMRDWPDGSREDMLYYMLEL